MHALLDFLHQLIEPTRLSELIDRLHNIAYVLLCGIVFAETGLLIGFFLPGDSLLFTVGVVCGFGKLNIVIVDVLLMASAIAGDNVGYFLGRRAGPQIFSRPKSRLFNPDHLERTRRFYEKHGGKTIIYARFIPIVRTCTPFVAGVARMRYSRFLFYSLFGGMGWIFFITLLGYSLGSVPWVRQNFEKVILLIIVLSIMPVLLELRKKRPAAASL